MPTAQAVNNSSVTLFGVADLSTTNVKADGAGNFTRVQGEGRNESSRLGLRGYEDLGGGWGAGFWFEAGVNFDSGAGSTTTSNNTSIAQNGILTGAANSTANATLISAGGQQGLTFNRASTVSLINKDLGEARIGRDYVPTFWNYTVYDPFGTVGVGSATNLILGTLNGARAAVTPPGNPTPQVRSSNSIGWLSPSWSGFRAQAMVGLSEQVSTCTDLQVTTGQNGNLCSGKANDGKYTGFRLSYANGPLSLAAASGETTYNSATAPTAVNGITGYSGNFKALNFGGAYDAGVVKVFGQTGYLDYGQQLANATTAAVTNVSTAGSGVLATSPLKVKHNMLGLTAPVGAWTLKASYATAKREGGVRSVSSGFGAGTTQPSFAADVADGSKQTQIALGAVYDLSKRTAVYGTYSKLDAKGLNATASMGLASAAAGAANTVSSTGVDIGIRHRF